MRRTRTVLLVATLVVGLAAPATAKKGGSPGAPSGTGLEVTVEPVGVFVWANSIGDELLFDVTVANTSGGKVTGLVVTFEGATLVEGEDPWPGTLEKNAFETRQYAYTVVEGDFDDAEGEPLPFATQTEVTFGEVKVSWTVGGNEVEGDAPAVTTAYPVQPCPESSSGADFTWGPNPADYTVCALTPGADLFGYWTMTTKLPNPKKGKGPISPAVTVRDGVPGNWCNRHYDDEGNIEVIPQDVSNDRLLITDRVFFPTGNYPEAIGVCLGGGAAGDTIPVRNHDTFYLATWKDNEVNACSGGYPDDVCPPSNDE